MKTKLVNKDQVLSHLKSVLSMVNDAFSRVEKDDYDGAVDSLEDASYDLEKVMAYALDNSNV